MTNCKLCKSENSTKELLVRYSIYVVSGESDYDGRNLDESELRTVREHLRSCDRCQQKVDQLRSKYLRIETFLIDTGVPGKKGKIDLANIPAKNGMPCNAKQAWITKPALYYTICLLVIVCATIFFFSFEKEHVRLSEIDTENLTMLSQSELAKALGSGLTTHDLEKRRESIQQLQRIINQEGASDRLYYAHLVLGILLLLDSNNGLPGLLAGFDQDKVNLAIINLEMARDLTMNPNIAEDCFWYLGKAQLMKEDWKQADSNFQLVMKLRGSRHAEAERISSAIAQTGLPDN